MEIKNISFSYENNLVLNDLSLSFKTGKITAIIGPNGSGKSTLLMLLGKIFKPDHGKIYIDNQEIRHLKMKDFAKKVAVVHQQNQIYGSLDVSTIVSYGRVPYLSYYQNLTKEDCRIVDWALEITKLSQYANRPLNSLSGGQQQRVWLAMALAQKTPILLLDEPTTYLDITYQIEILNLIKEINQQHHITIIMVHHDINQAMHYSDEIIGIKNGEVCFQGEPEKVISKESLKSLYDYDFQLTTYNQEKIVLNYD